MTTVIAIFLFNFISFAILEIEKISHMTKVAGLFSMITLRNNITECNKGDLSGRERRSN